MNSTPIKPAVLAHYETLAQHLIDRYDWHLLAAQQLVTQATTTLPTNASDSAITQQLTAAYMCEWYAACRNRSNLARCETAYNDLSHCLYRVAFNRWPCKATDVTQRALELVWLHITNCRHPEAFLQFALWKLRQAAKEIDDDGSSLPQDLGGLDLPDDEMAQIEDPMADITLLTLNKDCAEQIMQLLRKVLNHRELIVILCRFYGDHSHQAIAEKLNISVSHSRKLCFDALKKLRQKTQLLTDCFDSL